MLPRCNDIYAFRLGPDPAIRLKRRALLTCHASHMETSHGGALVALSHDIAGTVERIATRVVAVEGRDRTGSSGFFVRPGIILTADHALENDDIEIVHADGKTESARIVGRDSSTDLALLAVADSGAGPIETAGSGDIRVGAIALAVARDDDGDVAATMGVIGSIGAAWRTWRGGEIDRFIRPDLSLYPRFSGSPLVDAAGRLIGLNTWGLSRRQPVTVPAATIARVVEALATRGHVTRGYLGIAMQAIELPEHLGGGSGVIALGIAPDGPAQAGGLMLGDIITSLRGRRIGDSDDVQAALDSSSVGAPATVGVLRGGKPLELAVTIGERPRHDHDE
jgi:S1-C subfamily serine protease